MFETVFLKRLFPFLASLVIGFYAASPFISPMKSPPQEEPTATSSSEGGPAAYGGGSNGGSGSAADNRYLSGETPLSIDGSKVTSPLKILAKPRALFTDLARVNETQGTVRLRIVLLASGNIGSISVIQGLQDGLTEQAIEAARQIKFEPAKVNGHTVSKTVTVEYNFTLY
jgi:TonB family protein